MAIERLKFLEILQDSYSAYYNIFPNEGLTELPLAFRADFFTHGESYFLIKGAKIWADESAEYVYLFSAPQFDPETVKKCVDYAVEDGLPRVHPHKEHRYTNFIAIFVADSFDAETAAAVKAAKFSKSYKYNLWGFSLLKTAAVDLSTEKVTTNREGHDLTAFYKKLFASRKEGGHAGRNKIFSLKE